MWKPKKYATPSISLTADSSSPAPELIPCAAVSTCHQSIIGKSLMFTGEITGSESFESLFIEGSVQGSINLPDCRVTVGQSGRVTAGIVAGNIVVMGQVNGNLTAFDRIEIRAQASVTGDTTAPRMRVEDGAFLNGRLDVSKTELNSIAAIDLPAHAPEPHKIVLVRSRSASSRIHASLQSA